MPNMQREISRGNTNDEYYTPPEAVKPILKYVPTASHVWCPFDTQDSMIVKMLRERGCEVTATHIWNGQDFFEMEVPECDFIISNPPYSKKTDVLRRLMDMGKPFAMLMNVSGIFDNKRRWDIIAGQVEFLWLRPRINYLTQDGNTQSASFQSAWLCHNLLPEQLMFHEWR